MANSTYDSNNSSVTNFSSLTSDHLMAHTHTDFTTHTPDNRTFNGSEFSTSIPQSCELLDLNYGSDLKVPIYGYAMPVLLLTTTTANTLVVAVLSRQNMRTPSNTILLAISLADLFTIVVPAPLFFYMYTLGYYQNLLTNSLACYAWTYLTEVAPNLFHTASVWLSLALAAQRYIYICHSPAAHVFCTQPRIVKIILFIFLAAVVHQLPRFLDFQYVMLPVVEGGSPVCYSCYAKWVFDVGASVYFPIYFWLRVIFVHLLPCALLLIFNLLLYKAVRQAQNTRKRLLQENHKTECKRSRENCITMMLLVVVSITTVTEIPLAVLTLLHILTNTGVQIFSVEDYDSVNKYLAISNFCIICSYPLNFAVYCSMSRQFRETFAALFLNRNGLRRLPREDSSRYSTVNGHRTSESVL